ncbi:pyridoxamine 5'-phosphate oxidase [Proteiniphilum sp.]|uniref:pyridoxamine 5'-phosphate oxidase n=1 Tax=Proteiniphilum sp. TaxID=1926877 RepID=UPI002B20E275|nr:pyridoxamine 5'-phosphate oxidase [Proteiniphilum sp.]MEA4919070.1 pyridoxamine 5'-phosphate oxidase [Proteiniphilum sp.]
MDELNRMRKEYRSGSLKETEMTSNPFDEFQVWLETAITSGLSEPNAMIIASATPDGRPSARVVLLKELNKKGFVFYTNYMSRKGRELLANPFAAAVFDWHEIERQVRIEGIVEKVEDEESDAYFNVRPNDAKIGAWASPQSRIVRGRKELEELEKKYTTQFAGSEIPRPSHWGGFLIQPTMIEFWQGRPNRMHDRMVYYKVDKGWNLKRLAP